MYKSIGFDILLPANLGNKYLVKVVLGNYATFIINMWNNNNIYDNEQLNYFKLFRMLIYNNLMITLNGATLSSKVPKALVLLTEQTLAY